MRKICGFIANFHCYFSLSCSTGWGNCNSETMDNLCEKFNNLNINRNYNFNWMIFLPIVIFIIIVLAIAYFSITIWCTFKAYEQLEIERLQQASHIILVSMIITLRDKFYFRIPKPSPEEVATEIFTPHGYLSTNFTMKPFTDIVNRDTSNSMINPRYFEKPDIQILLYMHEYNVFNVEKNQIGHYICVSYDSKNNSVNIYDSCVHFYTNTIKLNMEYKLRKILRRLYPSHSKIVWKIPRTLQYDISSCGVFAIAYATLLICGQDPELYELNFSYSKVYETDTAYLHPYNEDSTMPLRHHIWQMFCENRIIPFPSKYVI